ncbi:hypothetical protein [Actinophytocola sp.]|uniref:hypothetical protein n=1 Tax=Actinophytocola sp. TaxID=1872138 RepID=UPI002ED2F9A9
MTQTLEPVPPTVARRGARLLFWFVLLVVAAMTTTAGVLGASSGLAITLIIFGWVIAQFVPFLPWAFRPVLTGTDLTAWTVSGRRTVDLRRLAKVGRMWFPGNPQSVDTLVLLDTNGVRLIVDDAEVDDAVFESITDPECAEPRVAAGAGHRLGLIKLPIDDRVIRGFGAVLLAVLYFGLTLVAIISAATVIEMIAGQ